MKRKCLAVGIILLFIGTCIIPTIAQDTEKSLPTSRGNWLYVGGSGPGNYTQIQDAINDSIDGDTVFVFHGLYNEKVTVNKSIRLIGENNENTTIIHQNQSKQFTINMLADRINISGFTIKNYDSGGNAILCLSNYSNISGNIILSGYDGIEINKKSCCYNNIFNNSIEVKSRGIEILAYYGKCSYNNIIHNRLTDHNSGDPDSGPIFIFKAASNTVKGNYIYDSRYGIIVDDYLDGRAKNNIIIDNIIDGCSTGIKLGYNPWEDNTGSSQLHSTVIENTISNCSVGIYISCNHNIVEHNILKNNSYGLQIAGYSRNTLSGNTFDGNLIGIALDETLFCNVSGNNIITSYFCGIIVVAQSPWIGYNQNVIQANNFIQNRLDAMSYFTGGIWNGNYWERPRLLPKLIFGIFPFIQVDWHPAIKPYVIPEGR